MESGGTCLTHGEIYCTMRSFNTKVCHKLKQWVGPFWEISLLHIVFLRMGPRWHVNVQNSRGAARVAILSAHHLFRSSLESFHIVSKQCQWWMQSLANARQDNTMNPDNTMNSFSAHTVFFFLNKNKSLDCQKKCFKSYIARTGDRNDQKAIVYFG